MSANVRIIADGGERLPLYSQREVKFTISGKVKKKEKAPLAAIMCYRNTRISREVHRATCNRPTNFCVAQSAEQNHKHKPHAFDN